MSRTAETDRVAVKLRAAGHDPRIIGDRITCLTCLRSCEVAAVPAGFLATGLLVLSDCGAPP